MFKSAKRAKSENGYEVSTGFKSHRGTAVLRASGPAGRDRDE